MFQSINVLVCNCQDASSETQDGWCRYRLIVTPPQVHENTTTAIDGGSVIERSGLDGPELPGEGGPVKFFSGKRKNQVALRLHQPGGPAGVDSSGQVEGGLVMCNAPPPLGETFRMSFPKSDLLLPIDTDRGVDATSH